jgi:thymidylate synthase (FAD)
MEAGNDLDFELREARLQDETNRQNSIETDDYSLQEQWEIHQAEVISVSESAYNWAVDNGIALEQARVVLPEGLTKSKMYMNGTLRSWIHYISLRSGNGTQKEHMEIARAVAEVITKVFPLAEEYVN